jgi:maltooligosyltrehalose trehalohydrolase
VQRLQTALGRHLVVIAESDLNDPRVVWPEAVGGYGLDAQWNEDFHHALHAALTGERDGYYRDFGDLAHIAGTLQRGLYYDGRYSPYRDRAHGRPAAGLDGRHFVGCLQNHDQIGNRARGERSGELLSPGLLKVGATLVLTAPFVPMLFQGEAWGATTPFLYFTDHPEPELAEAVRQGRRREFSAFGWDPEAIPDPQSADSFERSRLDWDERSRHPHSEIMAWHRALIELRRVHPAFADDRLGQLEVRFDEQRRWLTLVRPGVVIACNLQKGEQSVDCPEAHGYPVLLRSSPGIGWQRDKLRLPGESVAVLGCAASP